MLKKHKKELERVYKEVYTDAYKKASEAEFQREINNINSKAREDARKTAKSRYKYVPKSKKDKVSISVKKLKKHNDNMVNEIMGW